MTLERCRGCCSCHFHSCLTYCGLGEYACTLIICGDIIHVASRVSIPWIAEASGADCLSPGVPGGDHHGKGDCRRPERNGLRSTDIPSTMGCILGLVGDTIVTSVL